MKKVFLILFLAVLVLFGLAAPKSFAGEGLLTDLGVEVSGDMAFNSIYMWRGIMLDGDPVVQPGFYLRTKESNLGRLKLGVWFNSALQSKDSLQSAETDSIIDYTYNFKSFDLSLGHIYYDFPESTPDGSPVGFSREFYTGLSFPKLFLSPSIFYYYDYGRKIDGGGEGSYTVLNLAYSIPFTVNKFPLSLDLSGHAGYNNNQYYSGKGGDIGLGAGLNMALTKNLSCKPNINYSAVLGSLADKTNANQKDRFYTGVYLSYVF